MAKRFTDTDKWKREWFHDLPIRAKLAWFYITDNCDHRGVWFSNFSLLSSQVGSRVTRAEFENWFQDKVRLFDDDKYFIPSFVTFQYRELNPENKAHKAVIKLIEELGPSKDLARSYEGAKDKDKDNSSLQKEGSGEKTNFDFESVYAAYPRKEGKAIGLKKLKARIKTQAEFETLMAGTKRFAYLSRTKEPKYIPLFSTFVEQERWLDSVPAPLTLAPPPPTSHASGAFISQPEASEPELSTEEIEEMKRKRAAIIAQAKRMGV